MTPACPQCRQALVADDINVAKDLAYCRKCNLAHELSMLVKANATGGQFDLNDPPPGISWAQDTRGTVIIASHRSWMRALGLLAASLFWNGIVSVFVALALSGTFHHLGVTAPEWFPAPKMNDVTIGKGELIFLWLFLTPFIAVGTGLALAFLSTLAGRTEVRVHLNQGSVFVGIGRLGWSRRFAPSEVKRVTLVEHAGEDSSRSQFTAQIEQENGKRIKFGSLLKEERLLFLISALQQALR